MFIGTQNHRVRKVTFSLKDAVDTFKLGSVEVTRVTILGPPSSLAIVIKISSCVGEAHGSDVSTV